MAKKQVSFNLEESIHLEAKKLALDKGKTVTELYTKWITDGLQKETSQTSLDQITQKKQFEKGNRYW